MLIKKIICFIFGHKFDWEEYDKRIEKEEHYTDARLVYCSQCKSYMRIKPKLE